MEKDMLEDMTAEDGETEATQKVLEAHFDELFNWYKQRYPNNDEDGGENSYLALRWAIWRTFRWSILRCSAIYFASECCSIGFTSFLMFLVRYIRDDEASTTRGITLVAIFTGIMVLSSCFRNAWYFWGLKNAIQVRKTLVAALYTKITKLSMKSLTETNSGKLITLVSGDIQAVERALPIVPTIFAVPFINLIAYTVLGVTSGWEFALWTFIVWIIIMIC